MKNLINKAKKTLINNRRKGYTLPTNNKLYPAQWNWDSGFIALGYSCFNLNFALKEIDTLLKGQWNDGMVPHILFHETNTNYYPNYTAWNCGNKIHSSGITQPPILATILKRILVKNKLNKTQLRNVKKIRYVKISHLQIEQNNEFCVQEFSHYLKSLKHQLELKHQSF